MPDALTVLADDHRHVLDMLDQLTGGAGEPAGGERERKAIAEQVAIAESKHEAIEELCFWPVVRTRLEHGEELAKQAIEQESSGKQLIHDLDHITAGDAEFMTLVHRLQSAVRDHISFEEGQVWPKLRLALSDEELEEMGRKLEAARRTAPTRPHPKTPPDPKVIGTIGPAVGALDRTRDALTGRGTGTQGAGRWRMVLIGLAVGVPAVVAITRALLRSGARADEEADRHGEGRRGALGGKLKKAVAVTTGTEAARAAVERGAGALGKAAKAVAGMKAVGALADEGASALVEAGTALAGMKAAGLAADEGTSALATAGKAIAAMKAAGALADEAAGALSSAGKAVAAVKAARFAAEHGAGALAMAGKAGKAVAAGKAGKAVVHGIRQVAGD